MKFVLFFAVAFLCLLSCKTQDYVSDNTNYSTPPEIGMVTTDLPRKSNYTHIISNENPSENLSLNANSDKKEPDFSNISTSTEEVSHAHEIIIPQKEKPEYIQEKTIQKEKVTESSTTITENNNVADQQDNTLLIQNPKPDNSSEKDLPVNEISDDENIFIKNLNVSEFSWEVGIKITQILDVRTLKEYKTGHIYDALNMDVNKSSFVNQIQNLDKTSPVAVYSQHGKRSIKASNILKQYGFKIIYNLKDGLEQWIKEKKEIFP